MYGFWTAASPPRVTFRVISGRGYTPPPQHSTTGCTTAWCMFCKVYLCRHVTQYIDLNTVITKYPG